jgi:hypothetical protein
MLRRHRRGGLAEARRNFLAGHAVNLLATRGEIHWRMLQIDRRILHCSALRFEGRRILVALEIRRADSRQLRHLGIDPPTPRRRSARPPRSKTRA